MDIVEASQHPSPDDLSAYSIGIPSDELLAYVDEHLADCSECAQAVSALVRLSFREDMEYIMDPLPPKGTLEWKKRRQRDNALVKRFNECWRSIPVDDEFWAALVRARVMRTRGVSCQPDNGSGYARRDIALNARNFKWLRAALDQLANQTADPFLAIEARHFRHWFRAESNRFEQEFWRWEAYSFTDENANEE